MAKYKKNVWYINYVAMHQSRKKKSKRVHKAMKMMRVIMSGKKQGSVNNCFLLLLTIVVVTYNKINNETEGS